jgi:AraC family transcriptional regulator
MLLREAEDSKNGQASVGARRHTAGMPANGRDRLRELLDAVLEGTDEPAAGSPRRLHDMAEGAFSSPFHFSRLLSRATGEPPVAMRRRVLLERAAWQLGRGTSVTDAAWAAGYESVEGFSRAFSRAFGRSPSSPAVAGHWLPAPNGIHFHPPTSLWVRAEEQPMNPLTEQMVAHDLDDTRVLLELAKGLDDDELRAVRQPGLVVLPWDGPEESVAAVLEHQVFAKEVWLAAIEGLDLPPREDAADASPLLGRHDALAPRWLEAIRDIDRRGAWDDRLIDALCDPPESFVLSSVVAHVLTFSAHRRQLARRLLTDAGIAVDTGDPILWLRARRGETP